MAERYRADEHDSRGLLDNSDDDDDEESGMFGMSEHSVPLELLVDVPPPESSAPPAAASSAPAGGETAAAGLAAGPEKPAKKTVVAPEAMRSLFLFTLRNPARRFTIRVVDSKWFTYTVLALILLNCAFMAINDPLHPDSPRSQFSRDIDVVFLVAFTIEICMRIFAMGLVMHKGAYLRNVWNCLDVIIVGGGWIGYTVGATSSISALRALRVLRPLRALTIIPEMRIMVQTLLMSLSYLTTIFILMAVLYVFFGLLGASMFSGRFHNQCTLVDYASTHPVPPAMATPDEMLLIDNMVGRICMNGTDGYFDGYTCPSINGNISICKASPANPNPNYGFTSFDNFAAILLVLFQMMTMEGWSSIMYAVNDANGTWASLYFVAFILLGPLFVLRLAVAVLYTRFVKVKAKFDAQMRQVAAERVQQGHVVSTVYHDSRLTIFLDAHQRQPNGWWTKYPWISKCHRIATSAVFETVMAGVVVVNAIFLAAEHYGQPDGLTIALDVINVLVMCVFMVEMLIKLVGLGAIRYFRDFFNVIDFVVVIVGIAEFVSLRTDNAVAQQLQGITVLRLFRLLRLFKLLKRGALHEITEALIEILKSLFHFSILLFLLLFIYSLLGMEWFGGRLTFAETGTPRANFDNFWWSFVTVFQVLTLERWQDVMFTAMKADGWAACFFFISFIIVGNYILLNLFLAVVIQAFAEKKEHEHDKPPEQQQPQSGGKQQPPAGVGYIHDPKQEEIEIQRAKAEKERLKAEAEGTLPPEERFDELSINGDDEARHAGGDSMAVELTDRAASNAMPVRDTSFGGRSEYSFFLFSPTFVVRRLIVRFVEWVWFDNVILIVIALSCLSLAVEVSLDSPATFFLNLDVAFNVIFVAELLFKWFAYGVVLGKSGELGPGRRFTDWDGTKKNEPAPDRKPFFKNFWNVLDFVIVVLTLVSMAASTVDASGNYDSGLRTVRVLRLFRVLRPLRALRRAESMKLVVSSLVQTMPAVGQVCLLIAFIWGMFAILGVHLFSGKLWHCNDPAIPTQDECVGTYTVPGDPTPVPRLWENSSSNFDNVFNAMLTLFEVSSFQMWNIIMYRAVDAVGVGQQPRRDHNPAAALYFIVFIVIGSFLVLNLFVSYLVKQYNKLREGDKALFVSQTQQRWLVSHRLLLRAKPERAAIGPPASSTVRVFLFTLVRHPKFDPYIMYIVMVNILLQMTAHYRPDVMYAETVRMLNFMFTAIYTIEWLMKLIALLPVQFWVVIWNKLATFALINSILAIAYPEMLGLRAFALCLRFLKLLKTMPRTRILAKTLLLCLPSVLNVAGLLFLFLFTYGVLGTSLFGHLPYGSHLNRHANFDSVDKSMLTLFRMMTGEDWNGIMHDVMEACQRPIAVANAGDYNCSSASAHANGVLAPIFFLSFVIVQASILLNLLVTVVLQNYTEVLLNDEAIINGEDILIFVRIWGGFDPKATGLISVHKFEDLLLALPPPLGLKGKSLTTIQKRKFLLSLGIPVFDEQIHFSDVLRALARRVYDIAEKDAAEQSLLPLWYREFPKRPVKPPKYTTTHYYGARVIAKRLRAEIQLKKGIY